VTPLRIDTGMRRPRSVTECARCKSFIATRLLARYHSGTPIAVFILICAEISLVSTAMLRDYTNRDPAD
jgi:hypothetical protein